MSFILDKIVQGAREALNPTVHYTPEEKKKADKYYKALADYRRIIHAWLLSGTSEATIRAANLWDEDALAVQASSMGGGPPGLPGLPLNLIFTPQGRGGGTPPAQVERVERLGPRVVSVEEAAAARAQAGATAQAIANARNEILRDMAGMPPDAPIPGVGAVESKEAAAAEQHYLTGVEMQRREHAYTQALRSRARARLPKVLKGEDYPDYLLWKTNRLEWSKIHRNPSEPIEEGTSLARPEVGSVLVPAGASEPISEEAAAQSSASSGVATSLPAAGTSIPVSGEPRRTLPFRYYSAHAHSGIGGALGKKHDAELKAGNAMRIGQLKIRQIIERLIATDSLGYIMSTRRRVSQGHGLAQGGATELHMILRDTLRGGENEERYNQILHVLETAGVNLNPSQTVTQIIDNIASLQPYYAAAVLRDIIHILGVQDVAKVRAEPEKPRQDDPRSIMLTPRNYIQQNEATIRQEFSRFGLPEETQGLVIAMLAEIGDTFVENLLRGNMNQEDAARAAHEQVLERLHRLYTELGKGQTRASEKEIAQLAWNVIRSVPGFASRLAGQLFSYLPSVRNRGRAIESEEFKQGAAESMYGAISELKQGAQSAVEYGRARMQFGPPSEQMVDRIMRNTRRLMRDIPAQAFGIAEGSAPNEISESEVKQWAEFARSLQVQSGARNIVVRNGNAYKPIATAPATTFEGKRAVELPSEDKGQGLPVVTSAPLTDIEEAARDIPYRTRRIEPGYGSEIRYVPGSARPANRRPRPSVFGPGGAGGAPPPPPPPGGPGGWPVVPAQPPGAARRFWLNLKKIAIALHLRELAALLFALGIDYETVKEIVEGLMGGEPGVKVDVPELTVEKPEEENMPNDITEGSSDTSSMPYSDAIPPPGAAPPSATNAAYMPGIDGNPRNMPSAPSAIGYTGGTDDPITQPTYKVMIPEVAQPHAGKFDPKTDTTGSYDMDDPGNQELIQVKPVTGQQMREFNNLGYAYDNAKKYGTLREQEVLYSKLKLLNQEISNEATIKTSLTDLEGYGSSEKKWTYGSNDENGEPITLKVRRDLTEKTQLLGLNDDITRLNSAANALNELDYKGKRSWTPSEAAQHDRLMKQWETAKNHIDKVERNPYYADAQDLQIIEEKMPARVQELANKALANEVFSVTEGERALLEEYPSVGGPVLEYVNFRKRASDPRAQPGVTLNERLNDIRKAQASGYRLKPSERPFAAGQGKYPDNVKRVIDRIANAPLGVVVDISEQDRQAIAAYPELEAKVNRYEDEAKKGPELPPSRHGGKVFLAETPETISTMAAINEFKDIQKSGYESTKKSVRASYIPARDKLIRDRASLREATGALQMAIARGAPRDQIQKLYMRQLALTDIVKAGYADISGRGTFLAEPSLESLPTNEEERKQLLRLQNVEAAYQASPDELFEYNEEVKARSQMGKTKSEIYDERLQLLQQIAEKYGTRDIYDQAVAQSIEDESVAGAVANLPDDPNIQRDGASGMERATFIDPDEEKLFMGTPEENMAWSKRFDAFSYVPPGFGLGGPSRNPIQRMNQRQEYEQFKIAKELPIPARGPRVMIPARGPSEYQHWSNPEVFSDFGEAGWDDNFHNHYLDGKNVIWTDNRINSANAAVWKNPRNIYQPDLAGNAYMRKLNQPGGPGGVAIGECSKPGIYFGTNARAADAGGNNAWIANELDYGCMEAPKTMFTAGRAAYSASHPPRTNPYAHGRMRQEPCS
jgi:hypothetical protein